ncbi:right-handed parallel beta-helix repeat-containing protein [Natronomonas salina]|uniref:right-handed parallel beta-helix repeat-containing protein n=1 Tax=Natronomonas salina TaxID=1710540 RepID=UPI0015B383F1|nr:right-handed parallel beta-helix repeat-containing protein [Natronomonas salina]QLD90810.1 right-handed parallel beta-helix repeat-containing protein [Natronomonas salina]
MNGLHLRFGPASLTGAWRRFLVVSIAFLVAGSVLAPVGFSSTALAQDNQNQITSCTVIDEPGDYQLANDITADSPTECIEVRGVEATIDGNGNAIVGPGATGDRDPPNSGIVVNQSTTGTDLTVQNVNIEGWDHALFTDYVTGPVTVESSEIRDNGVGVSASYADQTTITDTVIEDNGVGFMGSSPTGVTLSEVTVQNNNGSGFSTTESRDVEIESSTFSDNAGAGIMVGGRAGTFTFSDITVTGNENHGIGAFADGERITIDGATVSDNGGTGIGVAFDAQITDADIQNNGERGLALSGTTDIENTLVAGNDGRELDARDGNASASGLTIGDSAAAAFSNESVALEPVEQDSLPDRADGDAAGDGMAVEGDVGSVDLELGVTTGDDTVDLWRHDGSEWSTVDTDIPVSDGSIVVSVGNAGTYAPGTTAGEETATPTQTASPTTTSTATDSGPAPAATETPGSGPGPSSDGNGDTDSTPTATEAAPSNPNPTPITTGTAGVDTATPAATDAPVETAVVGGTDTATEDGGTDSTEGTATSTDDEDTTNGATSPEPADDTENDGPGFGPLVAIGALLVSAVLARRRE